MISVPPQLKETAEKVYGNQRTRAVKVRNFLSWFGAQRRGAQVALEIRKALKKVKLETEPDFQTANIEGLIRFRAQSGTDTKKLVKLRATVTGKSTLTAAATVVPDVSDEAIERTAQVVLSDPTPRLGTVFASRKPVTVSRNDRLTRAMTLMVNHDYSQLPVMSGSRTVDGLISWKTIGDAAILHRKNCELVEDCLEKEGFEILPDDCPLPKAIKTIADNDFVLVRDSANEIVGIVTHFDLAEQYHSLAEPFLLLYEIEMSLRQLIVLADIPLEVLKKARDPRDSGRKVENVNDLSFGEYVRLLNAPENWQRIHLNLSRSAFMGEMRKIAKVRNEVMHFSTDPLEKEKLDVLRRAAQMMRKFKLFARKAPAQS